MNTHDKYELPPLPEARIVSYQTDSTMRRMELRTYSDEDMRDYARAAIEADRQRRGEPVELDRYDAGYLGGQDGMAAHVWHDIIRAELDRAYDFYMDQLDRATPQPAELGKEMTKPTMPEPVAYVTDVFQIVWSGTGPIASMIDRYEITTGTPLITTTQAEAYADARVRAALEEAANVAKQISDKYAYGYYGNEVDTADEIEAGIRALIPSTPA